MARVTIHTDPTLSRRAFLATTGSTLAGAAACGLVGQAEAAKRHPQRGGTLRFATRGDASGLDSHRNFIYPRVNAACCYDSGPHRRQFEI